MALVNVFARETLAGGTLYPAGAKVPDDVYTAKQLRVRLETSRVRQLDDNGQEFPEGRAPEPKAPPTPLPRALDEQDAKVERLANELAIETEVQERLRTMLLKAGVNPATVAPTTPEVAEITPLDPGYKTPEEIEAPAPGDPTETPAQGGFVSAPAGYGTHAGNQKVPVPTVPGVGTGAGVPRTPPETTSAPAEAAAPPTTGEPVPEGLPSYLS